MTRPPELLKGFANKLARAVVREEGAHTTRLLRLAGMLGSPSGVAPEPSLTDNIGSPERKVEAHAESPSPLRVGIWEGKRSNGQTYFVRRKEAMGEWAFWANVGRIEPKGTKRRVVLIGESVARGFLYDPAFNVAGALEKALQSQMGKGKVEVVDLARTNISRGLKELISSALLLEPDAVVIFAGNNWNARAGNPWSSSEPGVSERVIMGSQPDIPGFKRAIEERLAEQVRGMIQEVSSFYEDKAVPLIWMIPEFNLTDWRDPELVAPHLPRGANREWLALWDGARAALRDGDFDAASQSAKRMAELDGGTVATGLYILAECSQKTGDTDAARRYLELARDAGVWDCSRANTPRAVTVTQEILREEVPAWRGNDVVDLPKVFKEYLNGELPDRRLFLDYCHLTTEGIQVAVAAAASRVLRSVNGVDVHWRDIRDENIAPTREVEAEASFLAAVHNAHWAQPFDVVQYFCQKALRFSPPVAEVITRFADFQSRRAPMLMCRSAEEIAASRAQTIQHYLLHFNRQMLDKLLLEAVVASLKKLGVDAGPRLEELRREEHSVALRDTNLLDYYYASSARQTQEETWVLPETQELNNGKNYYTAYSPESRFYFVGEANRPVRLRLTCRLPEPEGEEGAVSVEVNGGRVAEASVGRQWGTWEIEVDGGRVRDGLNEVAVRWPTPAFPGEKIFESMFDHLTDKSLPEFFCPFGEIHTFTASDARITIPTV